MEEAELIERVKRASPGMKVGDAKVNREGQSNDIVIVDDEWVFRFAKSDAAAKDLEREAKVLSLLPDHVDLSVPESELLEPGVMKQRMIKGQSLDRHTLFRQSKVDQERLVEELAHFLFQLHRVPEDELKDAGVGKSPAGEGVWDAIKLFHECEEKLFPHLKQYAIDVVREHFEPVLEGRLSLKSNNVLVHADLNPSHILWDPDKGRLVGVIDFGMAGSGDSAMDYAHLILTYGETPLRQMHLHHRSIGEKIDRARFYALAIELKMTLSGLKSGDPRWFCAHIGTARDSSPIGMVWKD